MTIRTIIRKLSGRLAPHDATNAPTAALPTLPNALNLPIRPVMAALTERRIEALMAEDGFYRDVKRLSC